VCHGGGLADALRQWWAADPMDRTGTNQDVLPKDTTAASKPAPQANKPEAPDSTETKACHNSFNLFNFDIHRVGQGRACLARCAIPGGACTLVQGNATKSMCKVFQYSKFSRPIKVCPTRLYEVE